MNDIQELLKLVKKFRDERDWKRFHTPKELASNLMLESAEVLEHMQWKNGKELDDYLLHHKNEVGDELSDVLHTVLLMCDELNIDLGTAFEKKMGQNAQKYPIGKSKGKNLKWTKL